MFSKAAFVFAFFAVAHVAVATPPACLLAAVNKEDNPGALDVICTDRARDVQKYLGEICEGDADGAKESFAASCKAKGHEVEILSGDDENEDDDDEDSSSTVRPSATPTGSSDESSNTGSPTGSDGAQSATATPDAAGRIEVTLGAAAVGVAAGLLHLL